MRSRLVCDSSSPTRQRDRDGGGRGDHRAQQEWRARAEAREYGARQERADDAAETAARLIDTHHAAAIAAARLLRGKRGA